MFSTCETGINLDSIRYHLNTMMHKCLFYWSDKVCIFPIDIKRRVWDPTQLQNFLLAKLFVILHTTGMPFFLFFFLKPTYNKVYYNTISITLYSMIMRSRTGTYIRVWSNEELTKDTVSRTQWRPMGCVLRGLWRNSKFSSYYAFNMDACSTAKTGVNWVPSLTPLSQHYIKT